MIKQLRQRLSFLAIGALLLAGCAGPAATSAPTEPAAAASPTALQTTLPNPTTAPGATAISVATSAPAAATAMPSETSELEQVPTSAPLANVAGQVVLRLGPGSGADQVGVEMSDAGILGPRSFRIGADGSIRLLDNLNKRVLFFDQNGKLARTFSIAAAQDPQDFIVNNAGEVYVFDRGGAQVLRYSPKGVVTATIALGPGAAAGADGIMLNAAQDLMLVQSNQSFWMLVHQGVTVPPELQSLTQHSGTVTPRSPTVFQITLTDQQQPFLHVIGLRAGATADQVADVDGRLIQLPSEAQFFNVDRAMNLYFTRSAPDLSSVDVWRVSPDGAPIGGAHITTGACGTSWRSLYVDQVGLAWTMCVEAGGATIMRYPLLDSHGAPLPAAAVATADVPWRPGARLDAA